MSYSHNDAVTALADILTPTEQEVLSKTVDHARESGEGTEGFRRRLGQVVATVGDPVNAEAAAARTRFEMLLLWATADEAFAQALLELPTTEA